MPRNPNTAPVIDARIPEWLYDEIDPDIDDLGIGSKRKGGPQKVAVLSLTLYASIPRTLRVSMLSPFPDDLSNRQACMDHLGQYWPWRALKELCTMSEADRKACLAVISQRAKNRRPARSKSPRKSTGTRGRSRDSAA